MTLVLRGVAVMVSAITASRRASSEQPLGQSACGGVATEAMMDPAAQKSNRVPGGIEPRQLSARWPWESTTYHAQSPNP